VHQLGKFGRLQVPFLGERPDTAPNRIHGTASIPLQAVDSPPSLDIRKCLPFGPAIVWLHQNFGVPHPWPSPPRQRRLRKQIPRLQNSNLPSPSGRLGAFRVALPMGLINTASAALSSSGLEVKK
jgi:hypothetical protein